MKNGKKIVAFSLAFVMMCSVSLPVHAQSMISEAPMDEFVVESGWQGTIQDGTLCYISESGQRLTGVQEIDGDIYYFNEEGLVQTGWIELEGNKYYFSPETGKAYRDTSQMIDGQWYDFSNDGIAVEKISDEFQNEDVTEESEIVESEEEISESQDMAANDSAEDTQEDSLYTGWQTVNGALRYYSAPGEYLTGKCQVGGNWYFFDENGVCLKNQWVSDDSGKYYRCFDINLPHKEVFK